MTASLENSVTRPDTTEPAPTPAPGADRDFMRLAHEHYENFPVGSWLLPKAQRVDLHRIYAFARTADDIADEWRDAEALARFRATFLAHVDRAGPAPASPDPLFTDLATTIRVRDLPVDLFTDLLDAFEQDLSVGRYADDAALFDYCRRSADPVGRLVLRVNGLADPALDALSDKICTALQLLNHLQDLRSDYLDRDRIYFPTADLERHGVAAADLGATTTSPGVRALVREWAERTTTMLREGWPLTRAVRGRLRLELRAIVRGAAAVLARMRALDDDVLARRPKLGRGAHLAILLGAVFSSRPPRILR